MAEICVLSTECISGTYTAHSRWSTSLFGVSGCEVNHRNPPASEEKPASRGLSCKMTLDTHGCRALGPSLFRDKLDPVWVWDFIHGTETPTSHLAWSGWLAPEEGGECCSRPPMGRGWWWAVSRRSRNETHRIERWVALSKKSEVGYVLSTALT